MAGTAKPWWKSRTLRFNAAAAVLFAIEAKASLIQSYVPGSVYAWGVMILTAGNAALRVITTVGVGK